MRAWRCHGYWSDLVIRSCFSQNWLIVISFFLVLILHTAHRCTSLLLQRCMHHPFPFPPPLDLAPFALSKGMLRSTMLLDWRSNDARFRAVVWWFDPCRVLPVSAANLNGRLLTIRCKCQCCEISAMFNSLKIVQQNTIAGALICMASKWSRHLLSLVTWLSVHQANRGILRAW